MFGGAGQPNTAQPPVAPSLNRVVSSGDTGGFNMGAGKSKRKIVKPKRPIKK
jgi:hypothetical protein